MTAGPRLLSVEQIHAHTGAGCAVPVRIVERQLSLIDTIESPRHRVHGRGGADAPVLLHRVDERTPAERERALGRRADREPGDRVRIHEEDGATHVARQAGRARRDDLSRYTVAERHDVLAGDRIRNGPH